MKKFWLILFCLGIALADGIIIPPWHLEPYDQAAIIICNPQNETMIIQPKIQDISDYAWVVPVPNVPQVKQGKAQWFDELYYAFKHKRTKGLIVGVGAGGVEVVEHVKVGIYDVTILRASDVDALENWLRMRDYNLNTNLINLGPYIEKGWYVAVMKLTNEDVEKLFEKLSAMDPRIKPNLRYYDQNWKIIAKHLEDEFPNIGPFGKTLGVEKIERKEKFEIVAYEITIFGSHFVIGNGSNKYVNLVKGAFERHYFGRRYGLSIISLTPIVFTFQTQECVYPMTISQNIKGKGKLYLFVVSDNGVDLQIPWLQIQRKSKKYLKFPELWKGTKRVDYIVGTFEYNNAQDITIERKEGFNWDKIGWEIQNSLQQLIDAFFKGLAQSFNFLKLF